MNPGRAPECPAQPLDAVLRAYMRRLSIVAGKVSDEPDGESGQAAVEYAIMSAYLLVAGLLVSPWVMAFAPDMLSALQIYMDGFYYSFALPFP